MNPASVDQAAITFSLGVVDIRFKNGLPPIYSVMSAAANKMP
jgi:hypothetical protein